MKQTPIL